MADKPWDGRFAEKTDRSVEDFTASIDVDRRLYAYDIEGSVAHCRMLARTGIITDEEASELIQGLGRIRREIEHGDFEFDPGLEDIHMHIETRLVQEVGKVAQKLHTARSRNDQVAVDIRLYLREEILHIIADLAALRRVMVDLAKIHIDTVLPGYTHLQRAQPVLLAHHFMAYYEMLTRDGERFRDARRRVDVMPLGSAALAGTTYPIDRDYTAELLDFSEVSANSLDAVADRDFAIECVSAAAISMMHLSRCSEELILWSSAEFGFIDLPDAFATGSSIMPQKKNPDVPELVRGKTGRVYGDLMALLSMMKALPLAYNRDMQEDKEPIFDALDTLSSCLRIYTKMLPRMRVNTEKMMAAGSSGYLNATDLADYLVNKGMAFREAHNCAGRAVGHAFAKGKELHETDLDELRGFSNLIQEDVYDALQTRQTIDRRTSAGGTATANVRKAIEIAEKTLDGEVQT
ncbi:Argininosuccinate lyase (EC [Olavius algarvensis associated proteobacterium Delta 3]|nr:Argininosuccinate lyase (EC [Olavius algarvensis associated proteobacterium Delta 3]CAB5101635.1 Argininosuccinate lyase (EC [Olavius algarvensis associated proteobacterium Delta 3]